MANINININDALWAFEQKLEANVLNSQINLNRKLIKSFISGLNDIYNGANSQNESIEDDTSEEDITTIIQKAFNGIFDKTNSDENIELRVNENYDIFFTQGSSTVSVANLINLKEDGLKYDEEAEEILIGNSGKILKLYIADFPIFTQTADEIIITTETRYCLLETTQ